MRSEVEIKIIEKVRSILNTDYIENYRPDFLKNLNTGKNYEIDLYLTSFKLGFEIQGNCHFKYDSKRKTDLKKQFIADAKRMSPIVIMELFEDDLNGNFRNKIIDRIVNMQALYLKEQSFKKIIWLEHLYTAIKYGDSISRYIMKAGRVYEVNDAGKMRLVRGSECVLELFKYSLCQWNNKAVNVPKRKEIILMKHTKLIKEPQREFLKPNQFRTLLNNNPNIN